jgi:hypothetical protein
MEKDGESVVLGQSSSVRRWLSGLLAALIFLTLPIGPVMAEPRSRVDFILNGSDASVGSDPAPYSVPIYDIKGNYLGDRQMYPLRFVAETLGGVVDYVSTGSGQGNVIVANRHRYAVFAIGSLAYTSFELIKGEWTSGHTVVMDVAPALREGRTFLPVRFVAEALGATVSYNPVRDLPVITYHDAVTSYEVDQAVRFTGTSAKFLKGALTDDEILGVSDFQDVLDECGGIHGTSCGAIVPHSVPLNYARAMYLKAKAEGGGYVNESDVNLLRSFFTTALGFTPSSAAIRSLAQEGEKFVEEIASQYGWVEKGKLRYEDGSVQEVDVSRYNAWKRANPYRNGIDRIYFTLDEQGFVKVVISNEAKSTAGEAIVSRMIIEANNAPTVKAIQKSARSAADFAPDLQKLERYVTELAVKVEQGRMSLDEYQQRLAEITHATSNTGRPTQAVLNQATKGSRFYIAISRLDRVFWNFGRRLPGAIARSFRGGEDGDR